MLPKTELFIPIFYFRRQLFLASFFAFLSLTQVRSQTFEDVATQQGIDVHIWNNFFGSGVSFYDFNHDGWDDLSFATSGGSPKFFINNEGIFSGFNIQLPASGTMKHLVWVDYDNDGDSDIFATTFNGTFALYKNQGSFNFVLANNEAGLPSISGNTYGCSWGDYDADGFLDLFVCMYSDPSVDPDSFEASNHLYHNNGDGTFTDVTEEKGVGDGIALSFQSVWMDFDKDGDQDLYVINDKNYPNRMYENDGDGNFTEVGFITNSNIVMDAMTATVGDYDNDTYEDIYITNTLNPIGIDGNALLKKFPAGYYINVADNTGSILNETSWGAVWTDYDNDTFQDLYVCTYEPLNPSQVNFMLKNIQGDSFENAEVFEDANLANSFSVALGDINNDGYGDLVVSNKSISIPFLADYNAFLWQNSGGTNNWLKVQAQGTVSNPDGIGTWISVFAGGEEYVRYTFCGENYIGQNSQREFFGLGNISSIDSMHVSYLSGHTDVYYDVPINETFVSTEGETFSTAIELSAPNLCASNPVILSLPVIGTEFIWSTGQQGSSIAVSEAGVYAVSFVNEFGFSDSASIEVLGGVDFEYDFSLVQPTCAGDENGAITILTDSSSITSGSVAWLSGQEGYNIDQLGAGEYSFIYTDTLGCTYNGNTLLAPLSNISLTLDSISPPSCFGETDALVYYTIESDLSISEENCSGCNEAGEFSIMVVDSEGCSAELVGEISSPTPIQIEVNSIPQVGEELGSAELIVSGGISPYEILWSTGIEDSLSLILSAGEYSVSVIDANGCVFSEDFEIDFIANVGSIASLGIKIFPNPANEFLLLEDTDIQRLHIEVSDILGKRIDFDSQLLDNRRFKIDCSDWPSGMYILHFTGSKIGSVKIEKR